MLFLESWAEIGMPSYCCFKACDSMGPHPVQTGRSEMAVYQRTLEICALHSCHNPLGSLPWQEAAIQTGTMQSYVPLPGGCQELDLTSGHFSQGEQLLPLHSKPQTYG